MKMKTVNILVANGVNLDLLGTRQPEVYGAKNLNDLQKYVLEFKNELLHLYKDLSLNIEFFQTNHEGVFLDKLDKTWDGIILNPGAWTHTSIALADRMAGIEVPFVEVHLSNIYKREEFRKKSFVSSLALGTISGFGFDSYTAGLMVLLSHLKLKKDGSN